MVDIGVTDQSSIYVNNSGTWTLLESFEAFNVTLKQNQVSNFSISVANIESTDKVFIKEGAEVAFMYDTTLILKGRIQKITYTTAYSCEITGYGMEAVLLDKEFIKSSDKRVQYTNESAQTIANELLSQNSDGSSPWIMTPDTTGLFDTDYGTISMRYEYANRLSALAKLSEAMDYEWDVIQSVDPYTTDYFQIAPLLPTTARATTSQGTFAITGASANCSQTSQQRDITNVANRIDGLGYGDGVNQVSTNTYNASATYSTLGTSISDTATTIILTDATDFAASGEIRIMEERITYTGKSTNSLTGCTRAANSTIALEHKSGVFVEKYIAIASAESGSSIDTNGLMDDSIINRDILDVATLELVVSRELLKKLEPIVRIKVIPDEPEQTAEDYSIGDLVTITDSESDLDDDFRIVAIDFSSYYGDLSMELECSNRTLTFIEQMAKERKESEALGKYMQGSTNIYAISEAENCDSTHPLNLRFFVPNEAIAINKILLNFKMEDYRAYSTGITGAPNSRTNSSVWAAANAANWNFGWTSIEGYTDDVAYNIDAPYSIGDGFHKLDDWDEVDNVLSVDSSKTVKSGWVSETANPSFDIPVISPDLTGTFDKMRISFSYYHGTLTTRSIDFTIQRSSTGSSWSTVDSWLNTSLASGDTYSQTVDETTDYAGYYYRVLIADSYVNDSVNLSTCILTVQEFMKTTGTIDYGIEEESLTSPSVVVKVGEDGETLSTVDTYTTDQTEVDITDEVKDVGAGKWIDIQFDPNKNMRIEANAYIQIFIESK